MTSDNITVIMKPTNQCNLRCKYCYHADNGYDKEKMTGRGMGKYTYKPEYKKEGEQFFKEKLKKYFPSNEIKYIV